MGPNMAPNLDPVHTKMHHIQNGGPEQTTPESKGPRTGKTLRREFLWVQGIFYGPRHESRRFSL